MDDGCGGGCSCKDDMICSESRTCEPAETCIDNCKDARMECGELCGVSCGHCASNEVCNNGICVCQPSCDVKTCGDNGCGGVCECPNGNYCDGKMVCRAPEECLDTCKGVDWECGTVCGEDCGVCEENRQCVEGHCERVTSCMDCPLRLEFNGVRFKDNNIYININLIYQQLNDGASARMFELHIATDPPLELKDVIEGEALEESQKKLVSNTETGNVWYETKIGIYRLTALSLNNTDEIKSGVIARLEFAVPESLTNTKVTFWLERRLQILAPEEADVLLQISPYYNEMGVMLK